MRTLRTNQELYDEAKATMTGQWGIAAGATFIYLFLGNLLGMIPYIGNFSFIIAGPFMLGFTYFIISLNNRDNPNIEQLFSGFNDFVRSCLAYIVMMIFVLLWTLLFIIPGIMAGYSYSMTFYLLAKDKNLPFMDALRESREMMDGHRMRLFYLHLKFLGWAILALFTLGIGFFWLIPFMNVAVYKFFQDLKGDEEDNEFDNLADHLVTDF